jgi:hypothetical protein
MDTRVAIAAASLLGIALAGAGCGSGDATKGDGAVSSCQPAASGKGTISWLEDGSPECAASATATFSDNSAGTMIYLTGATPTINIGMGVSTVLGPAPIVGSYSCVPLDSRIVTFSYAQGMAAQTCELTLNMQGTPGVHATGTFSASVLVAAGVTKTITSGVFDVPVTILGSN